VTSFIITDEQLQAAIFPMQDMLPLLLVELYSTKIKGLRKYYHLHVNL